MGHMSKKKYILSIDQGTTSSRAILFDTQTASVKASVQQEFKQIFPKQGWVEHDPEEILSTQLQVVKEAVQGLSKKESIIGIGVTNQRETVIAWHKQTGKPLYNAIVWQDSRTSEYCEKLIQEGWAEKVKAKTGLVIDSYFSASKMRWMFDTISEVKQAYKSGDLLFGTVDTWLIWNLTGGKSFVTDVSNASRTMLFNIHTLSWDADLLTLFGIDSNCLATVKESSDDFGEAIINDLKIPITGVAGDQQAALFGQGCWQVGEAKNTYGTGCFMLMNTGDLPINSKNGMLTTIAWSVAGKLSYALEGSVFVAGSAIQWLRDGLKIIESAQETESLAISAGKNNEVVFVPAFAGLGAPYWDMNARGALFGLTRDTSIADIVKATLEALAFQTKDVLEAMQRDAEKELLVLNVDGGASVNNYLMQFQADMLGCTIQRPLQTESTALGVCFLAGLKVGAWTMEELEQKRAVERIFQPVLSGDERTKRYEKWLKAIEKTKNWMD
jgi:glycerol kinase